jgi:hypothetical protein
VFCDLDHPLSDVCELFGVDTDFCRSCQLIAAAIAPSPTWRVVIWRAANTGTQEMNGSVFTTSAATKVRIGDPSQGRRRCLCAGAQRRRDRGEQDAAADDLQQQQADFRGP